MMISKSPVGLHIILLGVAATLYSSPLSFAFTLQNNAVFPVKNIYSFLTPKTFGSRKGPVILRATPDDDDFVPGAIIKKETDAPTSLATFIEGAMMRFDIYKKSSAEGYGFKQSIASVLAGEYDADSVNTELDEIIQSTPCVMFTWESSPACKKAVQGFDSAGAEVKNVRLDNPWSEGNKLRAELGKKVGRSSVPCIFIGGKYVGGFDEGVSEDAPGIMALAFQGKLKPMLDNAGTKLSKVE